MCVIDDFRDNVKEELTPVDLEQRFDSVLDEIFSFEAVGGPFEYMQPSRVLRKMDPTAYRCGMNDWMDSEDLVEVGDEWYRQDKVERVKDKMIEEMEDLASDFIDDISEAEKAGDAELAESHRANLSDLIENMSKLKKFNF